MLRDLKTEFFYPHPPERVWQVLTSARALAAWLMDNDFKPRVGHKFRFQAQPQQGSDETIHCEVIELDEPRSLSYTWRGSLMSQPTIVTWTLEPVDGGTRLKLEHKGFESQIPQSQLMRFAHTWQDKSTPKATLETRLLQPIEQRMPFQLGYLGFKSVDAVTINCYLNGGWHTALNSSLRNMLSDMAA